MKISDIPKSRLNQLNEGVVATSNLTEWLAVDQSKLLKKVGLRLKMNALSDIAKGLPKGTVPKQIAWIGEKVSHIDSRKRLRTHDSDLVRCWACYADATNAESLKDAIEVVKPYASDEHFGLREIAWMAIRDRICENPAGAVKILKVWAKDKNPYLRRFASEATRPRGVWAKHITQFKEDPMQAESLLNILYRDPSRYVQDSVANWLNDASKDHPGWVKKLTANWSKKSKSEETKYIVRRALRSINK